MTGLVATGTASAAPLMVVSNDGWFPDIDLVQLRAAERLGNTITDARLKPAVIAAIISVNTDLALWQSLEVGKGAATLADVPAPLVDGQSAKVALYLRAVYSLAHADLIERYSDYDTTGSGEKSADELSPQIADQHRNARWAIRDLLGQRRTTVELI
ncbi:MAG: head completion/stabilization protein [Pseudomonas sp.]|uniref:head completion/stabilization protein n=1 Tax=Pseudomonas sp. TaxID=306 RepID=UPI0033945441